jgi:phosphonate transport system ATP-binding protein
MADTVFALSGVSKTYGAQKALDGVDLKVAPGEFLALIGPSGSGKSTLLRTLNGLVAIDPGAGEIRAFGSVLQSGGRIADNRRAIRTKTGFIFQQFNLVGRLSLFTNVMIGAIGRLPAWRGIFGVWPREERARALAALERVGVLAYAAQRANTLSGGQQQRGAIARALVQGAQALLADEPVASLDPASSRRVMEILRHLNEDDGMTVVVTLHQVDHALSYCRRIVALKAGKVVFDGPPQELGREALHAIYGEEVDEILPPAPVPAAVT